MADGEFCNASQRVDGKLHSWEFDGDDPRIKCCWCGEIRDALTGKPIKVSPVSVEPDPWELLRELLTRIEEAVRGVTVGTIRSTETYYTARDALKQHDAERGSRCLAR